MEKTVHEIEEKMEEDILIKAPAITRVVGIIGLLSGCLMSFWCYQDYLNGNETASVGIALGFLMIPGTLTIWMTFAGWNGKQTVVPLWGNRESFSRFMIMAVPAKCCLKNWRCAVWRWTYRGVYSAQPELPRPTHVLTGGILRSGLQHGPFMLWEGWR